LGLLLNGWPLFTAARFQVLDIVPTEGIQSEAKELYSLGASGRHGFSKSPVRIFVALVVVSLPIVFAESTILLSQPNMFSAPSSSAIAPIMSNLWSIVFGISMISLALLIIFNWVPKRERVFYKQITETHLQPYVASAVGILPQKSRVGSTYTLFLDFDLSESFKNSCQNRLIEVEL
jgi:hypothetical protein